VASELPDGISEEKSLGIVAREQQVSQSTNFSMLGVLMATCLAICGQAAAQSVVTLDFTNLPFADGTILTTEFQEQGIIFSDDGSGVDPLFPCSSLPGMDNLVINGELNNLFRIEFTTELPVVEVSARFRDDNANAQIHELFELDTDLQIVQSVVFDDSAAPKFEFDLQLSSPTGIAGIAACEQPIGAEALLSLTFTTADPIFSDGFETGDTTRWSQATL